MFCESDAHLPAPLHAHDVDHSLVEGHQQQRALVAFQCLLELFDGGQVWGQGDRARLWLIDDDEDPQQGRVAGPVLAHDTDRIAWRDGQIECVQECAVTMLTGEALCDERGSLGQASQAAADRRRTEVRQLALVEMDGDEPRCERLDA